MWPNLQFPEEILNRKLHFLCSDTYSLMKSCDLRPIMKCLLVFCVLLSSLYKNFSFSQHSYALNVKDHAMQRKRSFQSLIFYTQMRCRNGFEVVGLLQRIIFFELKTFSIPIIKNMRLFLTMSRYFLILNLCLLKKNYFFTMIICYGAIFLQWTPSLRAPILKKICEQLLL